LTAFGDLRQDDVMSTGAMKATPPIAELVPTELDADTSAIIDRLTTGRPLDPATYASIRREADRVRDEVFRRHGVLDIGVPAIREIRESE
jgi:hypothetical protein